MPTLDDAARITTHETDFWRICTGCGLRAPLTTTDDQCPDCGQPVRSSPAADHARSGWEKATRYAGLLGCIEAWAMLIPNVSDAERLTQIREALAALEQAREVA